MSAIEKIDGALAKLPSSILGRSGAAFYSALAAFGKPCPLYILGLNPGGSPIKQAANTVRRDIESWRDGDRKWSAYSDESWEGKPAGTHGMQPRMLHMFDQIGFEANTVPASNIAFVRSASEANLASEKAAIIRDCWPVHASVIDAFNVNTVLCLGGTAGAWVRERFNANEQIGTFVEQNDRNRASTAHLSVDGMAVITVTHPGRADWRNPKADPSPLIRQILSR